VTTDIVTTTGNGTWVAPSGVTSVQVDCWGGGGAGGGGSGSESSAGGGAGGNFVRTAAFTVTPGNTYNLHVATTRTATSTSTAAANKGDTTWFSSNDASGVVAIGGTGAAPVSADSTSGSGATASTTGCVGDTIRSGGNGAAGVSGSDRGGGGGGGAGTTAAGGNASGGTGGSGGSTSGGAGGTGATDNNNGGAGSNYGGGGGGADTFITVKSGGTGAQGRIELTYTAVTSIPHRALVIDQRVQAVSRASIW
jgi:hypothetical protein